MAQELEQSRLERAGEWLLFTNDWVLIGGLLAWLLFLLWFIEQVQWTI